MRRIHSLLALLAIAALSSATAAAHVHTTTTTTPAAAHHQHPIHQPHHATEAWQDCRAHGGDKLTAHYTIAELNHALRTMPAYVEEYSNCYGVIQAQILKQQLVHAKAHTKAHATSDGSSSSGSTVLIVAIAVVAIGGLGLAVWAYRRRRSGGEPPADGPPAA